MLISLASPIKCRNSVGQALKTQREIKTEERKEETIDGWLRLQGRLKILCKKLANKGTIKVIFPCRKSLSWPGF